MSNRQNFTQDRYLTDYVRMLGPKDDAFLAYNPMAAPVVDVDTMSGNFLDVAGGFASESPADDMVITDGMERPDIVPVSVSEVAGWSVLERARGVLVNKRSEQYANGNGHSLRRAKVARLNKYVRIVRERTLANLLFNATTFSGYTSAVGTQWDASGSDPTADALTAQESILTNTGETPNAAYLGWQVYKVLRNHPKILEIWSRTGSTAGIVPDSVIAEALDVDRIFVGKATANSAAEGLAESNGFIWGKYCLFAHVEQSPDPYTPQSCIQRWRFRGSADPAVGYYDLPGGYQQQVDMVFCDQFSVPTPALGYLWSSVVS